MAFEQIEKMIVDEVLEKVQAIDLVPIVKEAVMEMTAKTIEVEITTDGKKTKKDIGHQHCQFEQLLKYSSVGLSTYMVGPAGSGKTRAASEVANCLSMEFFSESVCQQSSAALLKGYMDANGSYVSTNFRKAFEEGGIFLLDEIDAGNPNVLTVLNAAVAVDAGQTVSFPDGMVKRHEKFICMAAANTFGTGSDRQYVGRNPLDAASLDRFVFIEWGYDEVLENEMAKSAGISNTWFSYIKDVRKAVSDLKIRVVVSPRATIFGGKLLQAGFSAKQAAQSAIFKGMDADSIKKLTEKAPIPSMNKKKKVTAEDMGADKALPPISAEWDEEDDLGYDHLIAAMKRHTSARYEGARGVDALILCMAKKDSGSFKAGAYYLQAGVNDDSDPIMIHCYGENAGALVSYTDKSNFSRKFRVCDPDDFQLWNERTGKEAKWGTLNHPLVHRAVKEWAQ